MNSVLLLLTLFASSTAMVQEQDDAKNRPVSKVIQLLKSMISELEAEGEEDEEVYENMGCWCETNDKLKTKAIADGEQAISDLTAAIESYTGSSARLNVEISNLEKEISKNNAALDQATALRKKELADFNAEEKEMLQTISSLKSAVIALSKHHSFIQEGSSTSTMQQIEIDVTVQQILQKHKDMMTPKQRKIAHAFVQGKAPQSSEIFGMLQQMKESFETNLANAQKDDAESEKEFLDMKAAKESEIKAGIELADTKTQELASTDEKNAQSKENLENTRDVLADDTAFLADLKERCENMDQEYEERVKTRQLEIGATSKALAYLNSDEAHDLFSKTFNFAQVSSQANAKAMRREQTSKLLMHAATKFQDPRLSVLATKARMDAFGKVKKSIQDMIDKLIKEKKDEIKHKDFCIEEINANERDTEMKDRDRQDVEVVIDDLTSTIDKLAKEIEVLKAEIAELQLQMKRAGEDREKQNKEFQTVIADQRATQKLLQASLGILKGFYDKAALVQTKASSVQTSGQAPPAGFKSYEKNKKSGGVMGMMQGIIDDAKMMEAEAIRGEEDSQKAYEAFIQDSNASVDEKTKAMISKSDMKAKAEGEKVEAETEHEGIMESLEYLTMENTDLHKACDFTVKNFEIRQTAREDEIDSLREGLATFSGASFAAFLDRGF
jgi:hypothetical protein